MAWLETVALGFPSQRVTSGGWISGRSEQNEQKATVLTSLLWLSAPKYDKALGVSSTANAVIGKHRRQTFASTMWSDCTTVISADRRLKQFCSYRRVVSGRGPTRPIACEALAQTNEQPRGICRSADPPGLRFVECAASACQLHAERQILGAAAEAESTDNRAGRRAATGRNR